MKDSGVEWIGKIPEEWEIKRVSNYFYQLKNKNQGLVEKNLLSLSYGNIVRRNIDSSDGLLPVSFDSYNIVSEGDIVLRMTDLQNDHKSLRTGFVREKGIITSAYITLRQKTDNVSSRYISLVLSSFDFMKGFYGLGNGVRQNVNFGDIRKINIPFPSIEAQCKIVSRVEGEVKRIDSIISETQQSINELKKYKQALITETVTKGLDKNVEMKDSGIEWIKKVPKSWEIKKTRFFLKEVSEKNYPNEEILSLYRDYGVIPKNSRDDNHNVTSLDTSGYKLVNHNQLVINKMKAWQGSMAISEIRGIISPAYYVYEVLDKQIYTKFLHYALRNNAYLDEYRRISAGLRIGQWDLNKDLFKNVKIAFPSTMDEQRQIVDFLEEKIKWIDNIVIEKEQLLIQFEQLKQSLIYEYVTGKKEA
ncbi:restriction endonuclease subunit S [Enterococcus faecium]|nr:restriction endonuclease subunit S [Enterococcus faecium]